MYGNRWNTGGNEKGVGMAKEKYETCIHAKSASITVVYVNTGCPRANMILGELVSSKKRCRECRSWKGKEK